MRKIGVVLVLALFLTGCGTEVTLETVADEMVQSVSVQPREVQVELPEEAVLPAMESDTGVLYMCKDYDVSIQTLDGGDMEKTIQDISGYSSEELTVMQTSDGDFTRCEFVWTTAGEKGERLGRGVILDDGDYHYCMSALREPGDTVVVWRDVFGSFSLI